MKHFHNKTSLYFTETHLDCQVTDDHFSSECLNYTLPRHNIIAHSAGVIVHISISLCYRQRLGLMLLLYQGILFGLRYNAKPRVSF